MKAERRLRMDLDNTQDVIFEFHCGNHQALERAQDLGRRKIMDAVQRNEISMVIAEGLKLKVDNWGY
jgi:hypothetical protein